MRIKINKISAHKFPKVPATLTTMKTKQKYKTRAWVWGMGHEYRYNCKFADSGSKYRQRWRGAKQRHSFRAHKISRKINKQPFYYCLSFGQKKTPPAKRKSCLNEPNWKWSHKWPAESSALMFCTTRLVYLNMPPPPGYEIYMGPMLLEEVN